MDNIKSYININVFCQYLIKIGIDKAHVHNFKLIHRKRYDSDSIDMPKLESKDAWMEFFCAYIKVLVCTKSNFKLDSLLVKKEIQNERNS